MQHCGDFQAQGVLMGATTIWTEHLHAQSAFLSG